MRGDFCEAKLLISPRSVTVSGFQAVNSNDEKWKIGKQDMTACRLRAEMIHCKRFRLCTQEVCTDRLKTDNVCKKVTGAQIYENDH